MADENVTQQGESLTVTSGTSSSGKSNIVENSNSSSNDVQSGLMSRVTSFENQNPPGEKVSEDFKFDISEIDKIADPHARETVRNIHKELEKTYQKKFQGVAEIKRDYEEWKNQQPTNQHQFNGQWTPERVRQLASDPAFVQAAQQYAGQTEEDPYSEVAPEIKQTIDKQQEQINSLQQYIMSSQNTLQHENLSKKYANYNPQAIDTLRADFIEGKVQAGNEHLYKVLKHDENVQRAYEMGRKDEREGNVDRVQSMSVDGQTTVASPGTYQIQEGESPKNFMRRIVDGVVKNYQSGQQIRK